LTKFWQKQICLVFWDTVYIAVNCRLIRWGRNVRLISVCFVVLLYHKMQTMHCTYMVSYHIISCTFLVRRYTYKSYKNNSAVHSLTYRQPNACLNKCLRNSVCESVSRGDGGRLFQSKGPATEKARSPNLIRVRTVVAALTVADWRRLRLKPVLTKCIRSQRYMGHSWCSILYMRIAILKVIRWRTVNQWSALRAGVMWALRSRPRTRRAAVFWTRCTGVIVDVGS